MFGFLKDKLKGAVDSIKKAVEDVVTTEEVEVKEKPKKKAVKKEKSKVEKKAEKKKEEPKKKEEKKEIKKETPKKEEKKQPEKKEKPKKEEKVTEEEPKVEVKKEAPKVEKKAKKKEVVKEKPVVEEEPEEEIVKEEPEEVVEEEKEEKKGFFKRLFSKKEEEEVEVQEPEVKKEEKKETKEKELKETIEKEPVEVESEVKTEELIEEPEVEEEPEQEIIEEEPEEEVEEEKKGFFKRMTEKVTKFNLSEDKFEELFWQLEVTLLENNVAVEVIEKIKHDLKEELTTGKVSRKGVEEVIRDTLRTSIEEVLDVAGFDLVKKAKSKKPYVIAFIGVNGSGKTTTMAKIAHLLMKNKLSVVFAASDTFRAAAIDQLQEHADKLGVKMIKHDYNADPAAVAFDAIEHAKSKGIDVVMIDTAGRLHSNDNLMKELEKLIRVNNPDMKIFIGESITGNDCVEQARVYDEKIGIDGIVLSKADVDEKGGAAISVSFITKKPILYLGTGQTYDDLEKFEKKLIVKSLGLD